ncbi:MAG: M56 family metallopeptidase [Holophagae bacterium]|jgi:beta-lactamase regulating signal transducer with metallopeptidase domain
MALVMVVLAAGWLEVLLANSLLVVVVFVVVSVLARLARKLAAGVGVALWGLVFARLVLPPGFSHPLSAMGLAERLVEAGPAAAATGLAAAAGGAGFDEGFAAASLGGGTVAALWPLVVTAAWFVGALTVVLRYRSRLRGYLRVVEHAERVRSPEVASLVKRWRSALKVRRNVRVVASASGYGPFTLGVFRPVIYLPASVLEDPSSREPAIAHEMVHVARLDALWLLLQHCLQAVYFFHPLVWVSGARLTEERERLADATVLAAGELRARDYALGLLRVVRLQLVTGAAPSMSAPSRRFRMRVHRSPPPLRGPPQRRTAGSSRLRRGLAVTRPPTEGLGLGTWGLGLAEARMQLEHLAPQAPSLKPRAPSHVL